MHKFNKAIFNRAINAPKVQDSVQEPIVGNNMSFISKPSNKYYLVLTTGLCSFFFLLIQYFFHFVPETFIGLPVQSIFSATLLTIFLTGLAFFAYHFNNKIKSKKATKLLNYPIILAVPVILIVTLPFLIWQLDIPTNSQVADGLYALSFFAAITYAVFTFFNIRKIFNKGSGPLSDELWKWLIVILAFGNIFNFITLPYIHPVSLFFLVSIGCFLIYLTTENKWIASLSLREKAIISMKFLLIGAATLLIFWLMFRYQDHEVFAVADNLLLIGIFVFVVLLSAFGMLAAFIGIPVSLLQNKEEKLLLDIKRMHHDNGNGKDQKEALTLMFSSCMKTSGAKGGTMIYSPAEAAAAEQVLEQVSIDDKDLKRISFSMIYNKEHFLIYNESDHIYIPDIKKHPVLHNHDLPFKSMLMFMVQVKQNAFAKLILLSPEKDGFDRKQIDHTSLLVQQTQLSLNNNMLFKDTLEVERFKKDMEIGKNLQKRLLPEYFPENDHFEIAAVSLAAEEVGGDYYDYHQFADNSYSFIIADVSGKGTPAAFHVAEMKGIFQSLSLSKIAPANFLKKANRAVSKCFDRGMFITLIHLTVDVNKKVIRYSRAGHCPVLFFNHKKGTIAYMEDDGLGLGILRNSSFDRMVKEHEISYDSGDILALYTDGLVEAKSRKLNEEYGFDRLKDIVLFNSIEKPDLIIKKVMKDVQEFAAFDLSRDDVSMVVIKMR